MNDDTETIYVGVASDSILMPLGDVNDIPVLTEDMIVQG